MYLFSFKAQLKITHNIEGIKEINWLSTKEIAEQSAATEVLYIGGDLIFYINGHFVPH